MQVLDFGLQQQLKPLMKDMKPLPSIYYPDFIAANQVRVRVRVAMAILARALSAIGSADFACLLPAY